MKKYIALFLAILMMFTCLVACAKQDTTNPDDKTNTSDTPANETPADDSKGKEVEEVVAGEKKALTSDETVTIALGGEPNTLIPAIKFNSNTNISVASLMYEPLIASTWPTEPNGEGLATSWEWVDDTHLRLHLREGVYFQNGEEFNADDVLYQMTQGMPGLMYDTFLPEECVAEDDHTVVLALAQPWGQTTTCLCTGNFLMIEDSALKAAGGKDTTELYLQNAGTGKYVMKEWKQGEYILLERNENYWNQEDPGYFKEIKFVFLSDTTANGLAAQSGDVDIAAGASLANCAVYEADPNVKVAFISSNNVSTLFLNSGKGGPCEDINVRKAIECLIDAKAIRAVAQFGYGELSSTIIAPQSPYYDGVDTASTHVVDVEKAKEYLAEAGYADGLTLRLRSGSSNTLVADLIQEQLRQGGIEVDIVTGDNATHFAALAQGDFDMYVSSQQAVYYSEALRCTDGIGWDYAALMGGCGYKDQEWHDLITRCLQTTDEAAKTEAMHEMQAQWRERTVSVALYTACGICVVRPDIEGITLSGVGVTDFTHIYSTNG